MKKKYSEKKEFIESLISDTCQKIGKDMIKNLDVYDHAISQIDSSVFNASDYHLFHTFFNDFFYKISSETNDKELFTELEEYKGCVIDKIYDLIFKTRNLFSLENHYDNPTNQFFSLFRDKAYDLYMKRLEEGVVPNYLLDYKNNNRLVDYYQVETNECLAHKYTELGVLPNDFPYFEFSTYNTELQESVAHFAASYNHLPDDFDKWFITDVNNSTVAHYYARYTKENFDINKVKDYLDVKNNFNETVLDTMIMSGNYLIDKHIPCPFKKINLLSQCFNSLMDSTEISNGIFHNPNEFDNIEKFINKAIECILNHSDDQSWLLKDSPSGVGLVMDYIEIEFNSILKKVNDISDGTFNLAPSIKLLKSTKTEIMESLFNRIDNKKNNCNQEFIIEKFL